MKVLLRGLSEEKKSENGGSEKDGDNRFPLSWPLSLQHLCVRNSGELGESEQRCQVSELPIKLTRQK